MKQRAIYDRAAPTIGGLRRAERLSGLLSAFHCIADRCRHNCCIGWEIDVDEDSLAAYDQIGGEMGERLHKCIDRSGEMPHFLLGEQERCRF